MNGRLVSITKEEYQVAAFDDLAKKATGFITGEKGQKALNSEKGEQVSDTVLDGVAGLADKLTGGKQADKIAAARTAADEKIGRTSGTDRPNRPDTGPDGTPRS